MQIAEPHDAVGDVLAVESAQDVVDRSEIDHRRPSWDPRRRVQVARNQRIGVDGPVRPVVTESILRHGTRPSMSFATPLWCSERTSGFRPCVGFPDSPTRPVTLAASRIGGCCLPATPRLIHPPHGGQGLNTGLQDAACPGRSMRLPENITDSHHAESRPVAARVLHNTLSRTRTCAPPTAQPACPRCFAMPGRFC